MKKLIILCAFAVLGGVLLQRFVQHDPGYILIVAWGKSIELRLGFALVLLVLAAVLAWLVVKAAAALVGSLRSAGSRGKRRRERKLRRDADQAVLLLLRGDFQAGHRRFLQLSERPGHAPWHGLAAARCALERGDYAAADAILAKTQAEPRVDETTRLFMQADSAAGQNNWQACAALLNQVKAREPDSAAVLTRLQRLYEATGDWSAMETLVGEIERAKVYNAAALLALKEKIAYMRLGLYGQEIEQSSSARRAEIAPAVRSYWQFLPKPLRQKPKFVTRFVQILVLLKEESKAEAVLSQTLNAEWHPELVHLYGALQNADAKQQLATAQRWQQAHSQDSVLQLTLGRICLRNQLWGQARDHFKASLQLHPAPEAYAELARLLAQLGDNESSLDTYRQGLLHSTGDWRYAQ